MRICLDADGRHGSRAGYAVIEGARRPTEAQGSDRIRQIVRNLEPSQHQVGLLISSIAIEIRLQYGHGLIGFSMCGQHPRVEAHHITLNPAVDALKLGLGAGG